MARVSINYGKYLYQYVNEIYKEWSYGKNYTVGELKEALREKILSGSPEKIDIAIEKPGTLNSQPELYIINEPNRRNYWIKHPKEEVKHDLFYYPYNERTNSFDERIIRKLNKKNPPKGIIVYWGCSQNPPKKEGLIADILSP